jgi:DNA invertase Pin-like site-specific DNA recombinase
MLEEHYRRDLSEKVRMGLDGKAARGIWPSSSPIGYRHNPETRKIEPDDVSAPLVRKAFELASTGTCHLDWIRSELFELGLRNRINGQILTRAQLRRILSNPIYYGCMRWKKLMYEGAHVPIVPKTLFDRVQMVLSARTSKIVGSKCYRKGIK